MVPDLLLIHTLSVALNVRDPNCGLPYRKIADFIDRERESEEMRSFIMKRMLSSQFVVEKLIYIIENARLIVLQGEIETMGIF